MTLQLGDRVRAPRWHGSAVGVVDTLMLGMGQVGVRFGPDALTTCTDPQDGHQFNLRGAVWDCLNVTDVEPVAAEADGEPTEAEK